MRKLKCILLALVSGIALSSCSNGTTNIGDSDGISNSPNVKMDKTFYNPLDIKEGVGDPWLYKHTDGYYYYNGVASSNDNIDFVTAVTIPTSLCSLSTIGNAIKSYLESFKATCSLSSSVL